MGRDNFGIVGDADGAIFEGGAEGIRELLFDCEGEVDSLDLILAEAFLRPFDEITADAAVIDTGPAQRRQFE